jgi:hypothetical protein
MNTHCTCSCTGTVHMNNSGMLIHVIMSNIILFDCQFWVHKGKTRILIKIIIINIREYRSGNKKWTIQRKTQHIT